jgi:hypothetical protein
LDLDECVLDRRGAWVYTIQEAVMAVSGTRVDAASLVAEYRGRPWRHALRVLVDSPVLVDECEALCREIFERSAMKRLLVHEGIGMALDVLRGASVEMGAISREPHGLARRQVESTGMERFVAVLSATPAGGSWDPAARVQDCLDFLGCPPAHAAFVSADTTDLHVAETLGLRCFAAAWAGEAGTDHALLEQPASIGTLSRYSPPLAKPGEGAAG